MKRTLATVALTAAVLAALRPLNFEPVNVESLAAEVAREEDHVTALELAQWLRDRKPNLRVLALDDSTIPRAERTDLESLLRLPFNENETIVLVSNGGGHAAQAWVFLRARGLRHVYFLRGGADEWNAAVLNPAQPTELTRYFGRRGC